MLRNFTMIVYLVRRPKNMNMEGSLINVLLKTTKCKFINYIDLIQGNKSILRVQVELNQRFTDGATGCGKQSSRKRVTKFSSRNSIRFMSIPKHIHKGPEK